MTSSRTISIRGIALWSIALAALVAFLPLPTEAKVKGQCADCHTMHNSQDGAPMALTGNVVWDGGALTGDPKTAPNGNLLIASCVGCHSNSTAEPIVSLSDGNDVPIVYNHTVPTTYLAGGNFYWVADSGGNDDTKGHNVYGVSSQDANISASEGAPGHDGSGCAGATVCHQTLAAAPGPYNYQRGGCQACHIFTYHHQDPPVYRFLKGHGTGPPFGPLGDDRKNYTTYPDYVKGIEDADWEYTTSLTDHNVYQGTTDVYLSDGTNGLQLQHTMTAFCSGCHYGFHGYQNGIYGEYGMGSGSPWLRHPTDVALSTYGEYGSVDPKNNYSTESPVAWTSITNATVYDGPVVMCLTCHRPHVA
ncbi:MAG: hypothetical protein P8Y75_12345 [Nitrospirota bacterium]